MALPNDKISIPMVARELGTTENDLGRLCIHPNINKWSRYKPLRHSSVTPLTAPDKEASGFGVFRLPSSSEVGLLEYFKPLGGSTSPFRLTDFGGYNHQALRPSLDTTFLDFSRGMFGNVPISENITYHTVITNLDMLKTLKNEGYRFISIYDISNNNNTFIENILIEDSMTTATGPYGEVVFSDVKTPNLPSQNILEFYLSKADHNNYVDAQTYQLSGADNRLTVLSTVTHESCITSVVSISRPANPIGGTGLFPYPVENYTHATSLGYLSGSTTLRLLINFPTPLTLEEKDMFNFLWMPSLPYNGVRNRRVEAYSVAMGVRTKIAINSLKSISLGSFTSPEGTVILNNCVEVIIILRDPYIGGYSQLEFEFFDGDVYTG